MLVKHVSQSDIFVLFHTQKITGGADFHPRLYLTLDALITQNNTQICRRRFYLAAVFQEQLQDVQVLVLDGDSHGVFP